MQRLFSLKFEALIIQILLPTCLYTDDLALPVGCLPLIPPHHSQLCILNQKSKQIACLGKRHFFPPSPKEFCLPGFLERLQCLIQSSTDIICCVLSQPPPPNRLYADSGLYFTCRLPPPVSSIHHGQLGHCPSCRSESYWKTCSVPQRQP